MEEGLCFLICAQKWKMTYCIIIYHREKKYFQKKKETWEGAREKERWLKHAMTRQLKKMHSTKEDTIVPQMKDSS